MELSPRMLDFDDVIELCGSVATSRGSVYKTTGAVRSLDWQPDVQVLQSAVQPSDDEAYRQRITIAPHRLEGECSCVDGSNCKHVAAALLRWIDEQSGRPGRSDVNLKAINRWLQRMTDTRRHGAAARRRTEPGEPLLFYRLARRDVTQHRTGIGLDILQSRLLKRGGYGKETPYRYHAHFHHPDWVTPDDRAILELAAARQPEMNYRPLWVEGDIGHLLMSRFVETGRCFVDDDRETPITRGPARALTIDWTGAADDQLRLRAVLDDVIEWWLIPADPPWYLDLGRRQAAPLDHAPPSRLLEDLLSAPPVPAAHAQAVSNYLASRLPGIELPLPSTPDFVRVSGPPEPILTLQSRDDSPDVRQYYASIRFRYGDYVLPFDGSEADATLEGRTDDGRNLVLHRDLADEAQRVAHFARRFPHFEAALANDPEFYSRADRRPRARDLQGIVRGWRALLDAREALEAEGWTFRCREPFELEFTPVTEIEATVGDEGQSWFDMSLELKHEGQRFDLLPLIEEWLDNDQQDRPLLLQAQDGAWLEVAPDVFRPVLNTVLELIEGDRLPKRLRLPRERAGALAQLETAWQRNGLAVEWQGTDVIHRLAERLAESDTLTPPVVPESVNASLRPYQLDGVAWLDFLAEHRFNGILADDMGLGKTLQTLTHLLMERESGRLTRPTLIVAPTSLLVNWQREIERFTPTLRQAIWHGSDRHERGIDPESLDILITSYALVTRDLEWLETRGFGCIVLDEAQAIKNPAAKVTQALKTLSIPRRLCLTGTPLENHLGELWSQFDFLMPGFLGDRRHFNRWFRTPIESHGDLDRQARLSEAVRPFMLRRRKEQVASDLPPKTEIVREVTLDGEQARLYESIRVAMEQRVRDLLARRGLAGSRIEMLDALLKLRQTCCHPDLVKLDSAAGVHESAKTELLMSMLEELVAEGKKILLFSQFTEMLSLIERELADRDIEWVKLTGRTRKRTDVIDAFQHGDVPLFLISLKAGGTGLNLTAADTVIHYDPWWNPAVENQASDRAHRIGQTKPVFVYKLVASNTVEERILAMQDDKRALAAQTMDQGTPGPFGQLDVDQILELFSADPD